MHTALHVCFVKLATQPMDHSASVTTFDIPNSFHEVILSCSYYGDFHMLCMVFLCSLDAVIF